MVSTKSVVDAVNTVLKDLTHSMRLLSMQLTYHVQLYFLSLFIMEVFHACKTTYN